MEKPMDDGKQGPGNGSTTDAGSGPARGVSWRSWLLSILVAVVLSALVTWFLGSVFHGGERRGGHAAAGGTADASGCGDRCCGEGGTR
jgi:hypothetical protein